MPAPSVETMKLGQAADSPASWTAFVRQYKDEMAAPQAGHSLNLLAALSHATHLSLGCHCEDESHCHRSVLRELLQSRGAKLP